jgi:hypothetical protein
MEKGFRLLAICLVPATLFGAVESVTVDSSTRSILNSGTIKFSDLQFDLASSVQGDLFFKGASGWTRLAKNVTATRYLSNTGASNNPAWNLVDVSNGVTGTLPINNGGVGGNTAGANTVFGNNTGGTATPGFQSMSNGQLPATISSKTFDDTNTYTAKDGSFTLENTTTTTKKAIFGLSNITAGNTRTVNVPDANSTTIQSDTGASNNFLTAVSAQGVISKAQPAFTNLSGSASSLQRGEWVNASTSSQTVTTTDTYITGSSCVVGAGNWAAGGQYRCRFEILKTNASTAVWSVNIRAGTAGTTADTAIIAVTGNTQTAIGDTMVLDINVNVRTIGASATSAGNMIAYHTAANSAGYGLTLNVVPLAIGQAATFNSTTATTIGVSFNGGASHSGTVTTVQASYMQ